MQNTNGFPEQDRILLSKISFNYLKPISILLNLAYQVRNYTHTRNIYLVIL